MKIKTILLPLMLAASSLASALEPEMVITVSALDFKPEVDGKLADWQALAPITVSVAPAIENDEANYTGELEVKLRIGMHEGMIYAAVRWPDDAPDTDFRPWEWRGNKYRRSKQRDDMFAMRFALSGDYNRSMIADANYEVDVWVWSAGRSNPIGLATDYKHRITLSMIENAAEYETESGKTVYIDRDKDAGSEGFDTVKVGKQKTETRVPSIEWSEDAAGSAADVRAKGVWADGYWTVEFARALDTGHDDDARLYPGLEILGQIAVFNRNGAEHKSVSEPLLFKFEP